MTATQDRISLKLVLFFLLLHVVNQIDRQLIAAFAGDIMRDLDLSRSQFALIAGLAFSGVYAFTSVAAGLLADRLGRVRVLTSGVAVWSLFTALAGLAQGFWTMLAARPLVASGEATLVPTASNIILARTPDRHKAAAIGLFFAGIPLGIGGSFLIAGLLGPKLGWRGCFLMMGLIGVAATFAVSRVRDPMLRASDSVSITGQLSQWWDLFRANRRLRWASLAMVFLHAHVAGSPFVQLWLHDDKGLTKTDANSLYGTMFVTFGLAGAVGSGVLTDWAQRRFAMDRALSCMIVLTALIPLIVAYRLLPAGEPLFLAGMAASVLFMTMLYGPVFTVIEAELPPHLKATATGINILALNILMIGGLAMAIGIGSDWLATEGRTDAWTWPLLGADMIAFTSLGFLWAAYRAGRPFNNSNRVEAA
ncbi:MAG: MFS transporter [Novosphingobium sp.]|uniref:MFS transporter n=1 Tax=Novosphingobium sp. TaxID=1874826 RepID=UPI003C79901C